MMFDKVKKYIEGKFLFWFALYILVRAYYQYLGVTYYEIERNYLFLLVYRIILVMNVMSFAYSCRGLSDKILKGNDISYGFYIYHMVVVNAFINLGYVGHFKYTVTVFAISIGLGWLSWYFVEKRILKFKNTPITFFKG